MYYVIDSAGRWWCGPGKGFCSYVHYDALRLNYSSAVAAAKMYDGTVEYLGG